MTAGATAGHCLQKPGHSPQRLEVLSGCAAIASGGRFRHASDLQVWKPAWCCALLVSAVLAGMATQGAAAAPEVGLLISQGATDRMGMESHTACDLAERLVAATVVLPAADGKFVDRNAQAVSLERFRAVWCHQEEPIRQGLTGLPQLVESLKQYVARGGGLLLSGGAANLVTTWGVDTVRTQPFLAGQDYGQAGLVPFDAQHPAFRGLDLDRGVLWMSEAVYPAYAAFHPTSNPAKGMRLAKTPGEPEVPLVEYGLGKGRILVMGWRLGRLYRDAAAEHRRNFENLTANLLGYLGDAKVWRPLTMNADGSPRVVPRGPEVPEDRWVALELAIRDLIDTFKDRYPRGPEYLKRLAALKRADVVRQFEQLHREALLANPLLDFPRLLLVKRGADKLGLPRNFYSNSSLPQTGYDNQIAVLSPVRPDAKLTTFYRPEGGRFVGDLKLHFDADRLLFSMPSANGRWQVHEIKADGSGLRELPLIREPDVDNYDACYLPDGRIIFGSTACFTGVPCVNGSGHVSNLYLLETNGKIRQLTVEQDHDWCPTVLNNGRVLYQRWEYTDLPHAFSRILFHMNPDGTEQMEYYGSNSYWPASMFFARPIPGHATKVAAIVGGHHEMPRMGDLVIFDPARGRFEADGVVQRIPGRGRKVSPAKLDLPIAQRWPKFLHPAPLSEKYFLASCKPSAETPWGIYLVDVFDNMVLLCDEPGYAMLEPVPLKKTPRPPAIPDKVDLTRRDAEVLIADLYRGEGLKGVPRGTIKRLRVFTYQFGYQGMGAEPYSVGMDGPWDPKIVLGTAPVCEDGSARFRVPAYTPIALQPLDADGKAVQLMRSWFTAMPGEVVSCVGCHEKQNTAPPVRQPMAAMRPPAEIASWYGPARGFAFRREVQPVLDAHCVRCHDGKRRLDARNISSFVDGEAAPMLKNGVPIHRTSRFSPSYYELRRFLRTPTKESDMHLLPPWEFHADTTRLVQMLEKGHHDVRLDAEAWGRLITWIDLNAPYHGNWTDLRGAEIGAEVKHQWQRRREMRKRYTGMEDDPEAVYPAAAIKALAKNQPPSPPAPLRAPTEGWSAGKGSLGTATRGESLARPLVASQPRRFSGNVESSGRTVGGKTSGPPNVSIALGQGVSLAMVRIPAGEFVMGQDDGCADERPAVRVRIESPFWMGRFEITNEQFAQFDPAHDSRLEHGDFLQFSAGERGWTLSHPKQPVVRVSWDRAMAFCRWLSQKTGRRCTLPTEAQWEYACRAGTTTPLWYGAVGSDFSPFANVADASLQAIERFGEYGRPETIPPWRPADTRYDDKSRVSTLVGSYGANPWGLFDMHGNVAEWTRSDYRPYSFPGGSGQKLPAGDGKKVVRGGSWYDRPDRCRSAFRQVYSACQGVYDVGFRVICEDGEERSGLAKDR